MANSKKRRKIIIFTVIGLILIALGAVAFFKKRDVVITIQTEKVSRHNLTEIVVANGKVQPVTQVVISPEVAGEIVALPVKEGQQVKKGDLLVQIKPDNYKASRNSAEANHKSALGNITQAQAELDKAETEFKRNQGLFENKLVSDSVFLEFKTAFDIAKLRYDNAVHQSDQARFSLDKATDDLSKTTILSPIDGTVTRLQSQLGERVLGTSFNKGTEIMTISDLDVMEARVDIGEVDVMLIAPDQNVRLEVDAFKDRKFTGTVTEIANSAKSSGLSAAAATSQDATKFEVHIRIKEKEFFRPGMSVTAEIETRSRTNVLTVPIASVTTRQPKEPKKKDEDKKKAGNAASGQTNAASSQTNTVATQDQPDTFKSDKKSKDAPKALEVVFVVEGDHVKMAPVKIGISDDSYWEITEGVKEGDEIVSGGYKAINRELEDGKKIRKGPANGKDEEEKK